MDMSYTFILLSVFNAHDVDFHGMAYEDDTTATTHQNA